MVRVESLEGLFKLKAGEFYAEEEFRDGILQARELYGAYGYYEFSAFPDLQVREEAVDGTGTDAAATSGISSRHFVAGFHLWVAVDFFDHLRIQFLVRNSKANKKLPWTYLHQIAIMELYSFTPLHSNRVEIRPATTFKVPKIPPVFTPMQRGMFP